MRPSEPLSPEADEAFGAAIADVCGNILARADAERKQSQPWKDLFTAGNEKGLQGILSSADHQMMSIALTTVKVIEEKFEIQCTDKLFNLIKMLCFAMNYVEDVIHDQQGLSCCADKARRVYYEEVMAEIEFIKQKEAKNS